MQKIVRLFCEKMLVFREQHIHVARAYRDCRIVKVVLGVAGYDVKHFYAVVIMRLNLLLGSSLRQNLFRRQRIQINGF